MFRATNHCFLRRNRKVKKINLGYGRLSLNLLILTLQIDFMYRNDGTYILTVLNIMRLRLTNGDEIFNIICELFP